MKKALIIGAGPAGLTVFTILASYYSFCFAYPFVCTMNFRYCAALVPLLSMGLGLLLARCRRKGLRTRLLRCAVGLLTAFFSLMSCVVYTQIG